MSKKRKLKKKIEWENNMNSKIGVCLGEVS